MNKIAIKNLHNLEDRVPVHALVAGVDLVIVRFDDTVVVLYGRCAHRGALMADGYIDGNNLDPVFSTVSDGFCLASWCL